MHPLTPHILRIANHLIIDLLRRNMAQRARAAAYGSQGSETESRRHIPQKEGGTGNQAISASKEIVVQCGPLLNYKRMSNSNSSNPIWHGSVLIVTTPGSTNVELQLRYSGPASNGATNASVKGRSFVGERLYEDTRCAFFRFVIDLPLQDFEARWEYHIPGMRHMSGSTSASTKIFVVPSSKQSMRFMFHSCNGFSVGTDEDFWSGTPLWSDVISNHEKLPIHVMIGGGDQIYNDGIRINGPLRAWTNIKNPHKRKDYPFDEQMRAQCDDWYLKNYIRWYSTEPFSIANGIIPQINVWDDHDIIDGFGSYTDHFMKCAVFRGIGGVAHKYYLLFQHHLPPPSSAFTTAGKSKEHENLPSIDPEQLNKAYIMTEKHPDPSFVMGRKPGPYVEERSMSLYTQLGAHIAFMGLDARTERTRHQINYPETYDLLFRHATEQITASKGKIKHLVLLLGVPIAYPRLAWLENILTSPIVGPIRFLSKRFGFGGGLFNEFDGGVDLLDDLDDHYTARQHKQERRELMEHVQKLAKATNIRVTILGGDVHLAAVGRFYSKPSLGLPVAQDHRYMVNIVSSAITNKPPPQAVANVLARRNKIHHLDHETDETLLNVFDHDPGHHEENKVNKKTADKNHCTMPSRNYALITESHEFPSEGSVGPDSERADTANGYNTKDLAHHNVHHRFQESGNPRDAMHAGETQCGKLHPAASGLARTGLGGKYGLDVTIRVEISNRDREGKTQGYGLTIPMLEGAV